jgi:ABC-type transport system involved in cytochrome bd biosynthesis fused ATPase/permease subunit
MIVIIDYLKDDDVEKYWGWIHGGVFSVLMISSVIFKNEAQIIGFKNSVAIRKSLTNAMYTKISKLSMRSLTETNSGKLITIVSGDL